MNFFHASILLYFFYNRTNWILINLHPIWSVHLCIAQKLFFFVFFGQNLSKPDQSSDGRKGVVMIGPNSCRLEIERPFQNFKNRVKEFSIFSTVLVKTSLHKFGKPISHQIFYSPLKYLLLEYCRYRLPIKTAVLWDSYGLL